VKTLLVWLLVLIPLSIQLLVDQQTGRLYGKTPLALIVVDWQAWFVSIPTIVLLADAVSGHAHGHSLNMTHMVAV
jgi:hypothetical protein